MTAFNKSKKAQAAMEFLMTYGWAILVVLIVIGALAYFGVLSPATLLPEKCTFPVSMSCTDHSVGVSTITFVLLNGAGRDMLVRSIDAVSDALGGALGDGIVNTQCITPVLGYPKTLKNGQSDTFLLTTGIGGGAGGVGCQIRETGRDKNRYIVNVTYSWQDSQTIIHRLAGELLAKRPI